MAVNLINSDSNTDSGSYLEIVKKIGTDQGYIWSGLPDKELLSLRRRLQSNNNISMPEEYALFLSEMNGFFYPGRGGCPGMNFFGLDWKDDGRDLETVNRDMRFEYREQMQSRILIGQSPGYLFAYNSEATNGKNYERLTNKFSVEESFSKLHELLKETIRLRNLLAICAPLGNNSKCAIQ